jgi:hypothetical protein
MSRFKANELQRLRNLEDKILCKACRCLSSTRETVKTLEKINTSISQINPELAEESLVIFQQLQGIRQRLDAYINTAEILAHRVQATLGLVSATPCFPAHERFLY